MPYVAEFGTLLSAQVMEPAEPVVREEAAADGGTADGGTGADIGAPDAAVTDGCEATTSGLSSMQITVRTVPTGGRFSPRNVGAIWIEDSDGRFVRALSLWGRRRAKWLFEFNGISSGEVVDGVTRATLPRHETHEVSWDLRDTDGCEVPAGPYQLRIEVTDWNGAGTTASIAFDKGEEPFERSPPDPEFFRDIVLRME